MTRHDLHLEPPETEPPTAEERAGLAHVSVGLHELLASPYLSQDAKDAVRAGIDIHRAHPHCPCLSCHRAYGDVP